MSCAPICDWENTCLVDHALVFTIRSPFVYKHVVSSLSEKEEREKSRTSVRSSVLRGRMQAWQARRSASPSLLVERIDNGMATTNNSRIIGKEDLDHLVAAKAHVQVKEAGLIIDALIETVQEEVSKGHQVRLIGFGSWKLTPVSARTIKSIRGGAPVHLPARKRVHFTVGSLLAKAAKAPTSAKKASRPSKINTR